MLIPAEREPIAPPPRYPTRRRPEWLPLEEPEDTTPMGIIYADLTLMNADDAGAVRQGFKQASEIRSVQVRALVDTDAYTMGLPEAVAIQLDLPVLEYREFDLADGSKKKLPMMGPVLVRFRNRQTICFAVRTQDEDVLLGAIPMQDLDVVLNPRKETIEVNPESPYPPKMKLKGFREA
jgi:clan AA aspartic protease